MNRNVLNGPRLIVLILTNMAEARLLCLPAKTASKKSVPISFYRTSTESPEIHWNQKTPFSNAWISAKTQRLELKLSVGVHGSWLPCLRLISSYMVLFSILYARSFSTIKRCFSHLGNRVSKHSWGASSDRKEQYIGLSVSDGHSSLAVLTLLKSSKLGLLPINACGSPEQLLFRPNSATEVLRIQSRQKWIWQGTDW